MNNIPTAANPAVFTAATIPAGQSSSASIGQYKAENLGDQPGSIEMCNRLNSITTNLENFTSPEIVRFCNQFTDSFQGLGDILVTDEDKLHAVTTLLASINCHDTESIKKFAGKMDNSLNEEASGNLKATANKDNTLEVDVPASTGNPGSTQKFSMFREKLIISHLENEFKEPNFTPEQRNNIATALIQAKMQLASGSSIGN